jgi:Cu(I)/Ag(I) efflux system membrane protein CusA/SilA
VILLYAHFRSFTEVVLILGALPFALIGGLWLMYLYGYNFSVAVGVGFIALAGVAVEISVIVLVYLNESYRSMLTRCKEQSRKPDVETLRECVAEGVVNRVRPVIMAATATIAGLLPIFFGSGTGSEVTSRIAAPMVGGMLSAIILTLLVLPVGYFLCRQYQLGLFGGLKELAPGKTASS